MKEDVTASLNCRITTLRLRLGPLLSKIKDTWMQVLQPQKQEPDDQEGEK